MDYYVSVSQILLDNYYIPSLKRLISANKIKHFYKRYSYKYFLCKGIYYRIVNTRTRWTFICRGPEDLYIK